MATFKHISSKNAEYGAAEQYLTSRHDEFTMKPTLDENGRLIPRDAPDNGLTVDRAQALGEEFCKAHFPGHQASEGKGIGYDRWAAVHNLKQMAATVNIYEESGFSSPEELEAALLHRAELKRCTECGGQFLSKSNRGKYCPDCAGRMKRIRAAQRKRKQRGKCHTLENTEPP